jgi:hypothetical protein
METRIDSCPAPISELDADKSKHISRHEFVYAMNKYRRAYKQGK